MRLIRKLFRWHFRWHAFIWFVVGAFVVGTAISTFVLAMWPLLLAATVLTVRGLVAGAPRELPAAPVSHVPDHLRGPIDRYLADPSPTATTDFVIEMNDLELRRLTGSEWPKVWRLPDDPETERGAWWWAPDDET